MRVKFGTKLRNRGTGTCEKNAASQIQRTRHSVIDHLERRGAEFVLSAGSSGHRTALAKDEMTLDDNF
jgi:hypothetical protein